MTIKIIGTGSYLPANCYDKIANRDPLSILKVNSEVSLRSSQRHISDTHETPTFMGIQAALNAIRSADIDPKSIDTIISYTFIPDNEVPRDVYIIANEIGCDGAMCWTIDTACASFISHLNCANSLTYLGKKRILLINSINWSLRAFNNNEGKLVGDGAGAIIVEQDKNNSHLMGWKEISSTAQSEFITIKSAQVSGKREEIQFTKNKYTLIRSVDILPEVTNKFLEEHKIDKKDINWVICHQPGLHVIERWHDSLGIPLEKNLNTYHLYGNMSAANIPITLDHFLTKNSVIKKDDLILFFTAGGGIHVAASLYRV